MTAMNDGPNYEWLVETGNRITLISNSRKVIYRLSTGGGDEELTTVPARV
jgi:hypothetical protein